jgi:hypothetical protein
VRISLLEKTGHPKKPALLAFPQHHDAGALYLGKSLLKSRAPALNACDLNRSFRERDKSQAVLRGKVMLFQQLFVWTPSEDPQT